MRAVIKWVTAAMLVAGGAIGAGCIAATGVGDYESCNQSNGAQCEICCATGFPDAKLAWLESLRQCGCHPDSGGGGPCTGSSVCGSVDGPDSFCHDPSVPVIPQSACDNCLADQIRAGCSFDHNNDYILCLTGCPGVGGSSGGG